MSNLENLIEEGWEKSRKKAHYPCLRNPEIEEETFGGAHFDFLKGIVKIGKKIIADYEELGISKDRIITGIFDHEIGHYMVFPKNLATVILLSHFAEKIFREKTGPIFQLYEDMVVDTHNVLKENTRDEVLSMRESSVKYFEEKFPSESMRKIRFLNLLYLCEQAKTEEQFSRKIDKDLASRLEKMMEIDFSRNANHEVSLYKYGEVIKDLLEETPKTHGARGTNGEGSGTYGKGDEKYQEIIKRASKEQIEEALREIIRDIGKKKYEEIKKWIKEIRGEKAKESSKGIGTEVSELNYNEDTARYYRELSRAYPLVVTKIPREAEKTKKIISGTEKWRLGKDVSLVLPGSSGGRILPGITKAIRINERPRKTIEYNEPNALVIIDTSGSMPNPSYEKSYAALGSCIVARSYHARGNYIGGINFDAKASIMPFTRNLDEAFLFLTAYKGGGTAVDIELVKKILEFPEEFIEGIDSKRIREYLKSGLIPRQAIKKNVSLETKALEAFKDKKIDVYMFTDGDIANQNEVLDYLSSLSNLNRAAIILTGGKKKSYTEYSKKIHITNLDKEEDIPRIAIREISRSIYSS